MSIVWVLGGVVRMTLTQLFMAQSVQQAQAQAAAKQAESETAH